MVPTESIGAVQPHLIDSSVAIGAADAGIYVGQSAKSLCAIRAEYNVAGIEIENSTFADVYDNVATNNTGGILVFDLPNLQVQGGQVRGYSIMLFMKTIRQTSPPKGP